MKQQVRKNDFEIICNIHVKTGEKIKLLRSLAGISQTELAEILEITQRDVVFLEQNKLYLKPEQIETLSNFFFCIPEFLIQKNFSFLHKK